MQIADFGFAPESQGGHAYNDANAMQALHLFSYDFSSIHDFSSIQNDTRVACGGKYLLVP